MTKQLNIRIATVTANEQISLMISDAFSGFFQEAFEWKEKAYGLIVTDFTQTDLMKEARQSRLAVKAIRVAIENKRRQLKEDYLKTGQAIDKIAGELKQALEGIEEHLDKQERFEQIETARIRDERINKRLQILVDMNVNSDLYNLGQMTDEQFDSLVIGLYAAKEKREQEETERQEREVKEAAERKEKEEMQKAEQDAIRLENYRLRQAKDLAEAEARRLAEDAALQLKAANDARIRAEQKLQAEADAAHKEIRKQEAARIAEANRLAAAPDKEILNLFAKRISEMGIGSQLKTPEAITIAGNAILVLQKTSKYIMDNIAKL